MERVIFFKLCAVSISLMFLSLGTIIAQEHTVSGNITDALTGKDPPGVNILVQRTSNYIISSMQMEKGSTTELSDNVENRTSVHIKKLNQSVGNKTNDSDII